MKSNDSNALNEVWEWKEKAVREVEHLSTADAIKKRLEDALQTVRKLGIPLSNALYVERLPRASNQ